jgi:CubicO group peptidase (beta-lactamase class C family)
MRRRDVIKGIAGSAIAWPLAARTAAADAEALKTAVAKLVKATGIKAEEPGIAVLVMRDGRPLLMEGYGLADVANRQTITSCTRFELASVSKTFTATAVLILQQRRLLSIDDDIRKFIPELPRYPGGSIRIRHLLHHVSGLTDYLDLDNVPKKNGDYWVNADYLPSLAKEELDFPTGEKYEYNNTNYMLLGLVVERAAKKAFGDFLREAIFVPAGMKNTFVYSDPASIPVNSTPPCNNAVGYETPNGKWVARWGFPPGHRQVEHLEVGDGAVWSSLEDMARWDAALRTNALIKPDTMKLALTSSKQNKDYGLGWELYHNDDGALYGYGHDGYWKGFNTSYYNYLTGNHTTVLLSNRGRGFDREAFWKKLNRLIEANSSN